MPTTAVDRADICIRQILANMRSLGHHRLDPSSLPRVNYELALKVLTELETFRPASLELVLTTNSNVPIYSRVVEAFELVNNTTGNRVVGVTVNDNLYAQLIGPLGHEVPRSSFQFISAQWTVDSGDDLAGNEMSCVTEVNRFVIVKLEEFDVETT